MKSVGVINIVKFILDSILDCGVLPINGLEEIIIKKLVDTSLDLLSKNIDIIHNIGCVNYVTDKFKKLCYFIYKKISMSNNPIIATNL